MFSEIFFGYFILILTPMYLLYRPKDTILKHKNLPFCLPIDYTNCQIWEICFLMFPIIKTITSFTLIIVTTCIYMCKHVCTYIYICIFNSLNLLLLFAYIWFQCVSIYIGQPIRVHIFGKTNSFSLSSYQVCIVLCVGAWPPQKSSTSMLTWPLILPV